VFAVDGCIFTLYTVGRGSVKREFLEVCKFKVVMPRVSYERRRDIVPTQGRFRSGFDVALRRFAKDANQVTTSNQALLLEIYLSCARVLRRELC